MSDVLVRDEVAPFQVMPPLSAEEYTALKADIAENGIEVAVEVDENGDLIDGHHRVKAWTELLEAGVRVPDYPRIRVSGLTHEQKRERAYKLNFLRRHQSKEQKQEKVTELRLEGKTLEQITSLTGIAKSTAAEWLKDVSGSGNVSLPETVIDTKGRVQPTSKPRKTILAGANEAVEPPLVKSYGQRKIEAFKDDRLTREYLEHNITEHNAVLLGQIQYKCRPETYTALWEHESHEAKVRYRPNELEHLILLGEKGNDDATTADLVRLVETDGAKSVFEAHKIRQEERKRQRQAKREAEIAAQTKAAEGSASVIQKDALEFLSDLEPESADLLLTDPPYMTDVDDITAFAESWVPLALSRLASTGRAYICTGAYPDELRAYLNVLHVQNSFTVENVLVWTYRNTLGPSPSHRYKSNWQATFYLRGPDAPPLECPVMTEQFSVQDINAPDGRQGDRYHAWQKPDELARRFIEHSTQVGQLVIDPFAGTGTFVAAAKRLKRHARGSEIDLEMLALCEQRGLEVQRAS